MRYFSIFLFFCLLSSQAIGIGTGWSQEIPKGFTVYQVKKGDTLWKITRGKQRLCNIIKRINRVDELHLRGRILIPTNLLEAKNYIPIPKNLKELRYYKKILIIYLKKQYFGFYRLGELIFWGPVSSGKKGHSTPTGKFKILWKVKKYYSKKYKASMPYALCLSNKLGIFLHAQALPGRPASHGCIRVLKTDAKRLFQIFEKGNLIIIKN